MAATLKTLRSKTKSLAIDIDGETITVQYTPRGYTAEIEDQIMAALGENRPSAMMIPAMLALVMKWDLSEEKGKPPIPLTPEGLRDVPTEILGEIVNAVTEDMNPKGATESA